MIRRHRVPLAGVLTREGFGARIEIGALLNDDSGALAAAFILAHEHGIAAGTHDALFLGRCIGRRSQQGEGAGNGKRGGN